MEVAPLAVGARPAHQLDAAQASAVLAAGYGLAVAPQLRGQLVKVRAAVTSRPPQLGGADLAAHHPDWAGHLGLEAERRTAAVAAHDQLVLGPRGQLAPQLVIEMDFGHVVVDQHGGRVEPGHFDRGVSDQLDRTPNPGGQDAGHDVPAIRVGRLAHPDAVLAEGFAYGPQGHQLGRGGRQTGREEVDDQLVVARSGGPAQVEAVLDERVGRGAEQLAVQVVLGVPVHPVENQLG